MFGNRKVGVCRAVSWVLVRSRPKRSLAAAMAWLRLPPPCRRAVLPLRPRCRESLLALSTLASQGAPGVLVPRRRRAACFTTRALHVRSSKILLGAQPIVLVTQQLQILGTIAPAQCPSLSVMELQKRSRVAALPVMAYERAANAIAERCVARAHDLTQNPSNEINARVVESRPRFVINVVVNHPRPRREVWVRSACDVRGVGG